MNNLMLKIDLTNEKFTTEEIKDYILEQYLGGRGLGVKLLSDTLNSDVEPLSPANNLIFSTGPLTGTLAPTSGRASLVTKSPLTRTIFYSNTGGFWGRVFKKCGFDVLFITGSLANDSKGYIVIDGEGNSEIKDASSLWGLSSIKTLERITQLEGNCQVLSIGPAGENLVRISSIMNQGHRAFGRGGVGAVMGAKGLKAIVVKNGFKDIPIKNPVRLASLVSVANDKIKVVPITSQGLPLFGTSGIIKIINSYGLLPVNNFQKSYLSDEKIDQISGERIREDLLEKDEGCFGCIIRCGRLTNTGEKRGKGPEFESLWALGPQCGITDLKTITHANYLCNDLGIDTISAGSTIACAMELQQRGIINDPSLKFGNASILCELVEKIAHRRDIGDQLAEGSLRFASKNNNPKYAMQVKGLEIPAYDPRGALGQALNFAVSTRGACHLSGYMTAMEIFGAPKLVDRFSLGSKADLLAAKQDQSAVEDSLVVCKFAGWAVDSNYHARFLQEVTGIEFSASDLIRIGERIYNLERLFNLREGFTKKDDTLPERFLSETLKEGPSQGRTVPLNELLNGYYRVRGWDEKGIPTDQTLEKLELKRLN